MSSTSVRAVPATVVAVVAVVTGVAVGLLSPHHACEMVVSAPATATATPAATSTGPSSALDDQTTHPIGAAPAPQGPPGQQPTGTPKTTVARIPGCVPGRFETVPAVVALAGVLLAGLATPVVLMVAGGGRPREPRPVGPAPRSPAPSQAPPAARPDDGAVAAARRAEADRAALVQACIFVRDRTTSKALAERLGAAMQQVGVTTVEPAGARFDPALHEAGGATPSSDPAQVGTIAAVEVPGYADRGRPLRAPVVTVYQGSDTGRTQERK